MPGAAARAFLAQSDLAVPTTYRWPATVWAQLDDLVDLAAAL